MNQTVPSGFWESLMGLESFHVSAVCMGVRRSATTMIYQIIRALFSEGGVIKTHSFLDVDPGIPVVATYRDFRDCVVSWWRTTMWDQMNRNGGHLAMKVSQDAPWTLQCPEVPMALRDKINLEETTEAIGLVKRDLYHLRLYERRGKKVLLLRYEDFWNNHEMLCNCLGEHIEREPSSKLVRFHSLQQNWALERFTDIAKHHNKPKIPHCHEGEPGAWRRFCTDEMAEFLTTELQAELIEFGYEESHS